MDKPDSAAPRQPEGPIESLADAQSRLDYLASAKPKSEPEGPQDLSDDAIGRLEKWLSTASAGPWAVCAHWEHPDCPCGTHRGYIWAGDGERVVAQMGCDREEDDDVTSPSPEKQEARANANLLVDARNALPALLAEVKRHRAQPDNAEYARGWNACLAENGDPPAQLAVSRSNAGRLRKALIDARPFVLDLLIELRHALLRTDGGADHVDLPASLRKASTIARLSNALAAIASVIDGALAAAPRDRPDALTLREALGSWESPQLNLTLLGVLNAAAEKVHDRSLLALDLYAVRDLLKSAAAAPLGAPVARLDDGRDDVLEEAARTVLLLDPAPHADRAKFNATKAIIARRIREMKGATTASPEKQSPAPAASPVCDCGLMVETHATGDGSVREHKPMCAIRRGGRFGSPAASLDVEALPRKEK